MIHAYTTQYAQTPAHCHNTYTRSMVGHLAEHGASICTAADLPCCVVLPPTRLSNVHTQLQAAAEARLHLGSSRRERRCLCAEVPAHLPSPHAPSPAKLHRSICALSQNTRNPAVP